MFSKLKTAALSAMIGFATLAAIPAGAQAEGLYLNYGAGNTAPASACRSAATTVPTIAVAPTITTSVAAAGAARPTAPSTRQSATACAAPASST